MTLKAGARPLVSMLSACIAILLMCCLAERAYAQQSEAPNNPVVNVSLLNGESVAGVLVSMNEDAIEVQSDNRTDSYPIDSIERIRMESAPDSARNRFAGQRMRLVDGSRLIVRQFTVSGKTATLGFDESDESVSISSRNIDWVRFNTAASLDDNWAAATQQETAGDTLYVLREGELQTLEGVIREVDDVALKFKFDSEEIEVKRTKLAGIAYYHSAGRELPAIKVVCHDRLGNEWMASAVSLNKAGDMALDLVCDAKINLAAGDLRSMDFTFGKILYVSDLPIQASQWEPLIDMPESGDLLRTMMHVEMNRSLNRKPLKLYNENGFADNDRLRPAKQREFARGIAMRSGTKLLFRLPAGYKKLTGLCGIDPEKRTQGHVVVNLIGDGQEIWQRNVAGTDTQPEKIDVDVDGLSELLIHVDYGKHAHQADHLNICKLRLIK